MRKHFQTCDIQSEANEICPNNPSKENPGRQLTDIWLLRTRCFFWVPRQQSRKADNCLRGSAPKRVTVSSRHINAKSCCLSSAKTQSMLGVMMDDGKASHFLGQLSWEQCIRDWGVSFWNTLEENRPSTPCKTESPEIARHLKYFWRLKWVGGREYVGDEVVDRNRCRHVGLCRASCWWEKPAEDEGNNSKPMSHPSVGCGPVNKNDMGFGVWILGEGCERAEVTNDD